MFALSPAENGVRAPDQRDALEVTKRARTPSRALPGYSVGALTG
ncbi:hypothetical protein [Nonomuraea sp. NPDC003201]